MRATRSGLLTRTLDWMLGLELTRCKDIASSAEGIGMSSTAIQIRTRKVGTMKLEPNGRKGKAITVEVKVEEVLREVERYRERWRGLDGEEAGWDPKQTIVSADHRKGGEDGANLRISRLESST